MAWYKCCILLLNLFCLLLSEHCSIHTWSKSVAAFGNCCFHTLAGFPWSCSDQFRATVGMIKNRSWWLGVPVLVYHNGIWQCNVKSSCCSWQISCLYALMAIEDTDKDAKHLSLIMLFIYQKCPYCCLEIAAIHTWVSMSNVYGHKCLSRQNCYQYHNIKSTWWV